MRVGARRDRESDARQPAISAPKPTALARAQTRRAALVIGGDRQLQRLALIGAWLSEATARSRLANKLEVSGASRWLCKLVRLSRPIDRGPKPHGFRWPTQAC
jgi:hypothetical protein